MSEIIVDCTRLAAEEAPKSVEEFKPLRGQARIFKNGITNEHALGLNFETAKDLLPNDEVTLSFSLYNDNERMPGKMHDFLDYCERKRSLTLPCYEQDSGRTYTREFINEPLYLFEHNCENDGARSKFVSCPEFLGDWFDKYFPLYRESVVYGQMHTWFFIGPKGTKSEMHSDHDFVHTTIQQLDGVKRFFLLSPKDLLSIVNEWGGEYLQYIEFDVINDSTCRVSSIKGDRDLSIFNEVDIYWGDINKYELVYLPNGWGHYAKSLSPSISVSRDFVDETNIDKYFFSCTFLSPTLSAAKHSFCAFKCAELLANHELLQEA